MIREFQIEDQTVEVNTSAGWLYVYRNRFGRDILPDIMPVIESVLSAVASILEESDDGINKDGVTKALANDALFDAFIKMASMEVLTVFNVFWAMAKNADPGIPEPAKYFNRFDRFPADEILPELFNAIVDSTVSSKNAKRLRGRLGKARAEVAKQSASTLSPSPESTEG